MIRNTVDHIYEGILPFVIDSQIVYMERDANHERDDEQTIHDDRRMRVFRRESIGDKRFDLVRKF